MSELRLPGLLASAAVAGAMLGGCSMPSMPSLFGSSPPPPAAAAAADTTAVAAFKPPDNYECPSVAIRQGAGTMAVSANPADSNALNLRYQFGFGETARQCRVVGTDLIMKVGISGRVIVGPAGGPGQIGVPVRLAVVQEAVEPRMITTKFQLVPVAIPPNESSVTFSLVEDNIVFPFPRGGTIDSYVVYIGFDPLEAEQVEKSRKKPPPRKPARRANTAQAR